jgi:hypothetical protein
MWGIVFLILLNISTILNVIYRRNQTSKLRIAAKEKTSESASVRFSERYFRDYLGFSQHQMSRFHEFNPVFRNKVRSINSELAGQRYRMLVEMSAGSVDTVRLNQLCDSIGYMHACLKRHTYRYYLELKSICEKQQKEKLEKLFGEMFAGDSQIGLHGQGGRMGRQRGRQISN